MSNEPPDPGAERDLSDDALRRLGQRLDQASEAAERLLADAAREAARRVPPAGWQVPRADAGSGDGAGAGSETLPDVDLLLGLLGALRDRIPPELQQRLADAFREVLVALRALIDWYLERADRRRSEPTEIKDIPIL